MVTLVTAFFRLSDRSVDEGEAFRQFGRLAACGLPVVLFLDRRLAAPRYDNVRVVLTDLGDVWPFCLAGEFAGLPRSSNPAKDTHDFLLLQNAKIEFLDMATRVDPSEYFAWVDFSVAKVVCDDAEFSRRLRALARRDLPAGVAVPGCWGRPYADAVRSDVVNWRFCGGFLLAERASISGLSNAHRSAFLREVLKHGQLTWEVNVWAAAERAGYPFHWYLADHDESLVFDPMADRYRERADATLVRGDRARALWDFAILAPSARELLGARAAGELSAQPVGRVAITGLDGFDGLRVGPLAPYAGGWLAAAREEVDIESGRVHMHRLVQVGPDRRAVAATDPFYPSGLGAGVCTALARAGGDLVARFEADGGASILTIDLARVDAAMHSLTAV